LIYKNYGSTGKKLSVIGFGGMRFQDIDNREVCVEMLLEAAKLGINYFDTAAGYSDGKSEEVFGEAFKVFRERSLPFYVATKTFAATEDGIRREIEAQLKRLQVDCIDFYHVWCITSLDNWQERKDKGVLQTFRRLKEEGLIRHICVSSHLIGDQIKELLQEEVFEGVLFGYSAYNFTIRQKAFEAITAHNLGCVVMNPLGGGLIPQNPKIFEFIKNERQKSVVEAALHFLIAHDRITTVLVGFSNMNEIREAVRAMDSYQPLDEQDLQRIKDAVVDSFEGLCTGCQYCDHCPEGIPVPKFMDAYNHNILYGGDKNALERLHWHWDMKGDEARAIAASCSECGQCETACTQHLPIIQRLKEIAATGKSDKS